MVFPRIFFLLALLPALTTGIAQTQQRSAAVLVIGGGTGGMAAGIQAARSGVQTIIAASCPMPGGMLTAAGVSCTDGNDALTGGIWQQFREALYQHYGTRNLATGWVSETCFEPHVGDSIFRAWAAREKKLTVLYGCELIRVIKKQNTVTGAVFKKDDGHLLTIYAAVSIDATELGDAMALAGAGYDLGMEDPQYSGEPAAPGKNPIIQDITWAAVLKDFGPGADKTIARPLGYREKNYYCSCTDAPCPAGKAYAVNALKMLGYARLPNNKYMINWPAHGNDSYLDVVEATSAERQTGYQRARQKTLGFIYFIQTVLGQQQLGLAPDELDSGMALIPYNREGRRLKGMARLTLNQISNPYAYTLYRAGISVGDYPVDHHHAEYPGPLPAIKFPAIPAYSIPLGALIPATLDGLIVAEKGISVSNLANGTTRLQPVVLLTGQAAGLLAALSVKKKLPPRRVPVRAVQSALLDEKAFLQPFTDVPPSDCDWRAIQESGATGLLRGTGKPQDWANKTFFYPDSLASYPLLVSAARAYGISLPRKPAGTLVHPADIARMCTLLQAHYHLPSSREAEKMIQAADNSLPLPRRAVARMIAATGIFSGVSVSPAGNILPPGHS